MRFKEGVILDGVSAHTVRAMAIVDNEFRAHEYGELIATSVCDGVHMEHSKHYIGDAFDCRIWYVPESEQKAFAKQLQAKLGEDYDVVLEKTHIHVEYDPS